MDVFPPSDDQPVLVQWLLDTRPLWPEAKQTHQLATAASRALAALLTDEDRAQVLRYFHVQDAKMALASRLLKQLVVARCAGVPWGQTQLTRDGTKPVFRARESGEKGEGGPRPLAFNVSHQAGLVVLAAVYGGAAVHGADVGGAFEVGVDVVSPGERRDRDHQLVAADGWPAFVDMHAEVLAPGEAHYLKHQVLCAVPAARCASAATATAARVLDRKLRGFYTLWCLREAYVKMTGDALLADWLRALEFRRFQPPPLPEQTGADDLQQHPAAAVTVHDIWLRGAPVAPAHVRLQALGNDYLVCTAIRSPARPEAAQALAIGAYERLRLEDILAFASAHGQRQ